MLIKRDLYLNIDDGIIIMNIFDFLLDPDSLNY